MCDDDIAHGLGENAESFGLNLREAAAQIPKAEQAAEALPLQETCRKTCRSRRKGPQAIGEILLLVLAKLGVGELQSESEAPSPDAKVSGTSTR